MRRIFFGYFLELFIPVKANSYSSQLQSSKPPCSFIHHIFSRLAFSTLQSHLYLLFIQYISAIWIQSPIQTHTHSQARQRIQFICSLTMKWRKDSAEYRYWSFFEVVVVARWLFSFLFCSNSREEQVASASMWNGDSPVSVHRSPSVKAEEEGPTTDECLRKKRSPSRLFVFSSAVYQPQEPAEQRVVFITLSQQAPFPPCGLTQAADASSMAAGYGLEESSVAYWTSASQ